MLYLIKRGPKPAHHKAPYHEIVVCENKRIAQWEVGSSGAAAWLWETDSRHMGWLLGRWNGFDIDYGSIVHRFDLPDGNHAGFFRDYHDWPQGVRDLLSRAVWWSHRRIPDWLRDKGVTYPADGYSQRSILDLVANDGMMGNLNRARPSWWPEPTDES